MQIMWPAGTVKKVVCSAAVLAAVPYFAGWEWGKVGNFINVLSTALVAVFTALLWDVSNKQAKKIDEANRVAMDANRVSTAAVNLAIASERAYIFVHAGEHSCEAWRRGDEIFSWRFTIKNHGKTPAIIDSIVAGAAIGQTAPVFGADGFIDGIQDLLATRDELRQIEFDAGLVLSSEESSREFVVSSERPPLRRHRPDGVPQDRQLHAMTGQPSGHWFWLAGTVTYRDVFGQPHETSFCLALDQPGHRRAVEVHPERNRRT